MADRFGLTDSRIQLNTDSGDFKESLGEFGRVWDSTREFGRFQEISRRVWEISGDFKESLGEFGRVWEI